MIHLFSVRIRSLRSGVETMSEAIARATWLNHLMYDLRGEEGERDQC